MAPSIIRQRLALVLLLTGLLGAGTAAPGLASPGPAPCAAPQRSKQQKKAKAAIPKELQRFVGSLEEAHQRAHDRNAPLILIILLEDEAEDIERFREEMLVDKRLIEASTRSVLIVSNNGHHEMEEVRVVVDGQKTTVRRCWKYRTPSCDVHRLNWEEIYAAFNEDGALYCPQVIVLQPDREISTRFNNKQPPAMTSLLAAIDQACKIAGPGLTWEQVGLVRKLAEDAARHQEAGRLGEAFRAWVRVLETTSAKLYAWPAQDGREAALKAMQAGYAEATAQLAEEETILAGYQALLALEPMVVGTGLEKDLAKAIKAAERSKRSRDIIRAWLDEQEAEALWREAQQLTAEKQLRKAEKTIRRILRRYGETPAGRRAAEQHPEWAAEERD